MSVTDEKNHDLDEFLNNWNKLDIAFKIAIFKTMATKMERHLDMWLYNDFYVRDQYGNWNHIKKLKPENEKTAEWACLNSILYNFVKNYNEMVTTLLSLSK